MPHPTPQVPDEKRRTIGSAIGSGVSNLITGYAAAPFLFAPEGKAFRWAKFRNPRTRMGHLRKIYGASALQKGVALSLVSAAGGAIREGVQAAYEKGTQKKAAMAVGLPSTLDPDALTRLAAGGISTIPPFADRHPEEALPHARQALVSAGILVGIGSEKTAEASIGLMLYTRHPSEQPNEGKRRPIKGPAKMFGNRMNIHHVRREEKKGHQDEWMRQNAEYVDLGAKPGLAAVLQDVFGMREGVPVPRAQLMKALSDKRKLQSDAVTRRRYAKIQGREHEGADSTHDTAALAKDLELLIENPDVRYVELARR